MDKVLFTIKRKHIVITVFCIFLILIFTLLLTKQYNFTYDKTMYYDTETKDVVIINIPAIFTTTVASYILLSIIGLLICNVSYCFSRKNMGLKNIFLRTNSKIYVIVGMLQAFIIVYNLSEMAMFAENCAIQILKIQNYTFIIALSFLLTLFSDIVKRIKTGQLISLLQFLNYAIIITTNIYLISKLNNFMYNVTNNIIGNPGSQLERNATIYLILIALIAVIEIVNKVTKGMKGSKKLKVKYVDFSNLQDRKN